MVVGVSDYASPNFLSCISLPLPFLFLSDSLMMYQNERKDMFCVLLLQLYVYIPATLSLGNATSSCVDRLLLPAEEKEILDEELTRLLLASTS